MSLILKLLGGSAGTYLLIAALATYGALGATVWVEHATIGEYEAKLATAESNLKQTVAANATDQGVIGSLQAALDTWKDSATKAAAAGAQLVADLEAKNAALDAANAKVATQETADNALPNCAKLEALDVGAVCPSHAVAERLHSANANRLPGPSSQGAGPDVRQPPQ